MYTKDLTEDFRLRLSKNDMDFLKALSSERGMSVSELCRSIIGEYRRSLDTMATLKEALEIIQKGGELSLGDTKTNQHDQL